MLRNNSKLLHEAELGGISTSFLSIRIYRRGQTHTTMNERTQIKTYAPQRYINKPSEQDSKSTIINSRN